MRVPSVVRGVILTVLTAGVLSCAPAPAPTPRNVRPAAVAPKAATQLAAATGVVEESKPRSPFAYANIDPADDFVIGPPDVRETCDSDLTTAGATFKAAKLPIHNPLKSKIICGAPQVVTYKGSAAKIAYQPSVLVTCTMALALVRFETIVQEEALRTFGKPVVKVHHVGTYACREMAAYPGWVSEHSYANAIDLTTFVLSDGRTIEVLKHFAPGLAEASTKEAAFLRAVTKRAYHEEVFSTVLTPFFDKRHANHFHLDLARFCTNGTSPL